MNISNKYLSFSLAGQEYAIGILSVREVLELKVVSMTKIYRTPDFFRGVINVRGSVVPIIDLKKKFLITGDEDDQGTERIIVLELFNRNQDLRKSAVMGILADHVQEVLEISDEDIQEHSMTGGAFETEYIAGIADRDGRFITLLDIEKILKYDEMALVNEELLVKAEE